MMKKNQIKESNVHPLRIADSDKGIRHVFIRDYRTQALIGAYGHEREKGQEIRINVDLSVNERGDGHEDRLENVVCYHHVIQGIDNIIRAGHINLVETLAERIADWALQDNRVLAVRVRVEKLEALPQTDSVGVEIERRKQ